MHVDELIKKREKYLFRIKPVNNILDSTLKASKPNKYVIFISIIKVSCRNSAKYYWAVLYVVHRDILVNPPPHIFPFRTPEPLKAFVSEHIL